jgi:uncharacterized coiled-coil protein SlyX
MSGSAAMDQRIIDVEEKLAFVERHVEELDEVVRGLYEKIDALRREMGTLRDETRRQFQELERRPEDDVPPHW